MGSPPETPYHDRHTLRYVNLFVSHEKTGEANVLHYFDFSGYQWSREGKASIGTKKQHFYDSR